MSKDFRDLSNYMNIVEPPNGLFQAIFLAIQERKKRNAKLRVFSLGFVSIFSFVAVFPIFSSISNSFSESGFYNYLSLVFSGDIVVLTSFWKEFMFSLMESAPFLGIALLLSVVAMFLWSSNKVAKNIGVAFIHV